MDYKQGQRIKVTIEGVAQRDSDLDGSDEINLDMDNGDCVYVETNGNTFGTDLTVEVVIAPLKDGLYYFPDSPAGFSDTLQMSCVYKLEEGQWYDSRLEEVTLRVDPTSLIPLVFGDKP